MQTTKIHRLTVVDALRGFALISIMLLHNIEHFDFYHMPEYLPAWIKAMDSVIWDTLFFLFGGKSYAIFALLFGLTYHIQHSNQKKRGNDFSLRFLWRLFLLLCFGILNSVFFEGDILAFYAIIGVVLIPFRKLSNKAILLAAIFFMIQPLELGRLIYVAFHSDYTVPSPDLGKYFGMAYEQFANGNFWEVAQTNLTTGRKAVILWSLGNGRFFQTAALFLLGFFLGRTQKFNPTPTNKKFWQKTLVTAILVFISLFLMTRAIPETEWRETIQKTLQTAITSWSNVAFTGILVSSFVLFFENTAARPWLDKLSPLGRMSLSNYVMQSIAGTLIYYGYGLGLYQYTGATFSLAIGIVLGILQTLFSWWWFKSHKRGPLEQIWHQLTWL